MKLAAGILALLLLAATVAAAATSPHTQARASLIHCRTVLARVHLGRLTRKAEPAVKRAAAAALAACADGPKLARLGQIDSDTALTQASSAELGVVQGLGDFGKYLADVAAGKTGHTKILNYSLAEISQARLLIAEALTELK